MKHIEKIEQKFREEYKKAYRGILQDDLLENGNPWFEDFLRSSHTSFVQDLIKRVEGEYHERGGQMWEYRQGYNKALDTIIKMLKEEI